MILKTSVLESVLVLSTILAYLLLVAFPILYNFYMSLHFYPAGERGEFVLFENYQKLIKDNTFWLSFINTLLLWLMSLGLQLLLGIYVSFLLYSLKGDRKRNSLMALFLIPYIMPSVTVAVLWFRLLDSTVGPIPRALSSLGFKDLGWFSDPQLVLLTFAVIDTWQFLPFVILILLGGMLTVPSEFREAAELDGATPYQVLKHIVLPLIKPMILTTIVLRSVDLLRFFDVIFITTQGGPLNASLTINIYAFRTAFEFFNFGYGATLASALFFVVFFVATFFILYRNRLK